LLNVMVGLVLVLALTGESEAMTPAEWEGMFATATNGGAGKCDPCISSAG